MKSSISYSVQLKKANEVVLATLSSAMPIILVSVRLLVLEYSSCLDDGPEGKLQHQPKRNLDDRVVSK